MITHEELKRRALQDLDVRSEYESLRKEFAYLDEVNFDDTPELDEEFFRKAVRRKHLSIVFGLTKSA